MISCQTKKRKEKNEHWQQWTSVDGRTDNIVSSSATTRWILHVTSEKRLTDWADMSHLTRHCCLSEKKKNKKKNMDCIELYMCQNPCVSSLGLENVKKKNCSKWFHYFYNNKWREIIYIEAGLFLLVWKKRHEEILLLTFLIWRLERQQ